MVPFEKAMVVSYRLCTVTIALALSLTIFGRNLSSNVSDAQTKTGGHFGAKFGEEGVD